MTDTPDILVLVPARELAELRASSSWRPIETAPKDGTHFLAIYGVDDDGTYWILFWNGKFFECVSGGYEIESATHWQSLPPSPFPSIEHAPRPPDIEALCRDYAARWLGTDWSLMDDDDEAELRIEAHRWLKCWEAVDLIAPLASGDATRAPQHVEEKAIALLRWGTWDMTPAARLDWKNRVEEFLSPSPARSAAGRHVDARVRRRRERNHD